LEFRSDIEGLRAVAILLVVAAHAKLPGLAGGFVGVDVFFVLSGHLITALLVQEARATGRIEFADFYARRFRRLLPALLLMLVCSSGLALLLLVPGEQPAQARAAAMAATSVPPPRATCSYTPGRSGSRSSSIWSGLP
jgi:peptidoglycan/LPS O-acetylase OafA/YrhL